MLQRRELMVMLTQLLICPIKVCGLVMLELMLYQLV
nr:MAG TPA: hypothetical protein [Bacteriophage sp.]